MCHHLRGNYSCRETFTLTFLYNVSMDFVVSKPVQNLLYTLQRVPVPYMETKKMLYPDINMQTESDKII
jgi:hypothetical protein